MFSRNRAKIILGLAATTKTLLDNYWLFTTVPLDSDHENEFILKTFYVMGQSLAVLTLWGFGVGTLLDNERRRENLFLDDTSISEPLSVNLTRSSFFKTNQAQFVTMSLGVTKALMDNYWLFTRVPLAGEAHSDPISKSLLIVGQCVVTGLLWGQIGRIIDYHRKNQSDLIEMGVDRQLIVEVPRSYGAT